jgi:DMSO/TMAO reductase YedYZ molybdopterin-dependent catalytic subunit
MTEPFISRGFRGRRQGAATAGRLPPGQYETRDFPVLSAGPTPRTSLATWDFTVRGRGAPTARWTWDELQALPHETVTADIHCVTKWSKLDTVWEGVSLDTLLAEALARGVESAPYILAVCDGGYSTNLPLADVTGGKAWVAVKFDGAPLDCRVRDRPGRRCLDTDCRLMSPRWWLRCGRVMNGRSKSWCGCTVGA